MSRQLTRHKEVLLAPTLRRRSWKTLCLRHPARIKLLFLPEESCSGRGGRGTRVVADRLKAKVARSKATKALIFT